METSRESRELHWRGVVERQASSGLNVAAFCRKESLSAPSFYAWRRKLRQREDEPGPRDTSSPFLPVQITPNRSSGWVRIVLPQGVSIEASSAIDHDVLMRIVQSLDGPSAC